VSDRVSLTGPSLSLASLNYFYSAHQIIECSKEEEEIRNEKNTKQEKDGMNDAHSSVYYNKTVKHTDCTQQSLICSWNC
jgi:hypothetical protein